ncbi:hypothetical protein ACYSNX_13065 [Myroides sp. LJL115]
MTKNKLKKCIVEALKAKGNKAKLIDICRYIWANYEKELENSGDLFYTWQYDIRWAATQLRKEGVLKPVHEQKNGFWELADSE